MPEHQDHTASGCRRDDLGGARPGHACGIVRIEAEPDSPHGPAEP